MIWCVDDDSAIREIEVYALNSTGFEAIGFESGAEMLKALEEIKEEDSFPELIVLDIMMPDLDGNQILKILREQKSTSEIPVIMATAKGQEYDKVMSLDGGADDYLVKPFGVMELIARVKAVLRRCGKEKKSSDEELIAGAIRVSLKERKVRANNHEIELTYKEFQLLAMLCRNKGIALSRDQILSEVWGSDYYGETRTVDMHIKTLRKKLGEAGDQIKTVINVGYRLEE